MEIYLEKLDKICKEIDKLETVKEYKRIKKVILKKQKLINLLEKYHSLYEGSIEKNKLKTEIYKDEDFILYKEKENELFYLILAINQKLNLLTGKRRCSLWE